MTFGIGPVKTHIQGQTVQVREQQMVGGLSDCERMPRVSNQSNRWNIRESPKRTEIELFNNNTEGFCKKKKKNLSVGASHFFTVVGTLKERMIN